MGRLGLFFPFVTIARRFTRGCLLLFLASALLTSTVFAAKAAPSAELEGILQKIESRNYRWIAIRSGVLVFFAGANNAQAMCGGELLYQRLDERMLLSCVDTRGDLVFGFRTLDRRFDLYLPSQNTIYHGSIFDLESSPDIESHLKARDLYRALKPLAVDPRRAKIERDNSAITCLKVFNTKDGKDILARKLFLNPEGDVRGEVYYDAAGRSATEIQRYDFLEIPGQAGSFRSIIYPKKITIISPEIKKGTALFFSKVKALDTIDPLEFLLRVPPGTKELFLDEKNPGAQYPKAAVRTSAAAAPVRPPTPAKKEMPVYYAKPREVPETKSPAKEMPVYHAKPREIPAEKKPRSPVKKEEKPPASKKPASAPVATVSADNNNSAEADIVVEDKSPAEQTPANYDEGSLDPSVEPTA